MQAKGAGPETIHDTPAVKRSHAAAQKVPEALSRLESHIQFNNGVCFVLYIQRLFITFPPNLPFIDVYPIALKLNTK